jgi:hypothetical protein
MDASKKLHIINPNLQIVQPPVLIETHLWTIKFNNVWTREPHVPRQPGAQRGPDTYSAKKKSQNVDHKNL